MQNAKQGNIVVIDYSVHTSDGTLVGDTKETGPQEIKLGDGAIFPQVEAKIADMKVGDQETVSIECDRTCRQKLTRSRAWRFRPNRKTALLSRFMLLP